MALIAAACIGAGEVAPTDPGTTPVPTAADTPAASPAGPSASIGPSDTPAPTDVATSAPTEVPTEVPTDEPVETPRGTSGPVALCAGNDGNRDFYAGAAANLDWAVYCPILPARWNVTTGTYQLARGGWLKISYKGPGGVRLDLSQGAFCTSSDGCVPAGSDTGPAAFGDMTGTLVSLDDGNYSIVVERGERLSWLATGVGIEADAFRDIVASLNRIEE